MAQVIRRGILQSFDSVHYTASVLLLEATSAFLTGVPVSNTLDGTSAVVGALCAVLFFDEHNPQDAAIIAVFPNASQGIPTPTPGRVSFVPPVLQVNAANIASGATSTYTLTGGASGIPSGALGVVYKAFFTCPAAGALVQMGPHGAGSLSGYAALGPLPNAGGTVNAMGLLQVDANGMVDVKASGGTCTFSLYTHGFVI